MSPRTPAIMVQGTASGVGKSWIATGLCRLLARRGLRVAPFKAQNMSNNAAPATALDGGEAEIGRAQAVQAEAAGVAPHVDMNPLLLKPTGERGSQVILLGRPAGHLEARRWRSERARFGQVVREAYDRLAARSDVIVLEGAGSPAEINLREGELVNMAMARHAEAQVILVGDIDRGGVFASLAGTVALLEPADRELLAGVVVNRFRGDPALLEPGLAPLAAICGAPVLGVVPMRPELRVDEEDSLGLDAVGRALRPDRLDVALVRLPTVSNFTDLDALAEHPLVHLRLVEGPETLAWPDLLVIPGSKDTLADAAWLARTGLDRAIRAAAAEGVPVLGICGGYQLLGERLDDPEGVAGTPGSRPGLGLLPVRTRFSGAKRTRPVAGRTREGWLLPAGLPVRGYEIRQGRTEPGPRPLLDLEEGADGSIAGRTAGTYVHGLLDRPEVAGALVEALRARRGLAAPGDPPPEDPARRRARRYDALADLLETHLDLEPVLRAAGVGA